jgi:LemA protein
MELNLIIVVLALIVIAIFWVAVGVRHLKFLRGEIKNEWDLMEEDLRKRQDLIPNLIETVRMFSNDQEATIQKLIETRILAAKEAIPSIRKIEYENDLTSDLNTIFEAANSNSKLATDTNFLELRKEIEDMSQTVETKTRKYNEMVRYYNGHRKFLLLKPIAAIFGYERLNIFEMEI